MRAHTRTRTYTHTRTGTGTRLCTHARTHTRTPTPTPTLRTIHPHPHPRLARPHPHPRDTQHKQTRGFHALGVPVALPASAPSPDAAKAVPDQGQMPPAGRGAPLQLHCSRPGACTIGILSCTHRNYCLGHRAHNGCCAGSASPPQARRRVGPAAPRPAHKAKGRWPLGGSDNNSGPQRAQCTSPSGVTHAHINVAYIAMAYDAKR
jgi:hypothetical protein